MADKHKNKYKNCKIIINDESKKNDKETLNILKELQMICFEKPVFERIGVKSHNAFAMIMNGYNKKKLVIKVPRRNDGTVDSLMYEYLVGEVIRQVVYPLCPNFNKIYGYLKNDDNEYLLIERILPGTSFREYFDILKTDRSKDNIMISLVLQVLYAIALAQERVEFTHYDLHFGNIVIKHDPSITFIQYTINNQTYTVPVYDGMISVIIDYGRSHVKSEKTAQWLNKPTNFKRYNFLIKRAKVNIKKFNKFYDVRRFCGILNTRYYEDMKLNYNFYKNPLQAINEIKQYAYKIGLMSY
jgi:hypothetical protein